MTISLVLAIQAPGVSSAITALLSDDSGCTVRAVAGSPEELIGAILDHEPDVVLLHEEFGPAPALAVARDLVGRLPWVSIVLLTRNPSVELYASATDAGIRGLTPLPASLADLQARITAAAWWSRIVRDGAEAKTGTDEAGIVLTVAGAKGGVGTTTIATQMAFIAASAKDRRVCLVDLDLNGARLSAYLGTTASRSISELVDLSDELSPGVVGPTLYPHESGVRVLFAPDDIADIELVTSSLTRRTIAVLRSMFDVVVIDVGCQILEPTLPAVELADRVALVVTPDLMAVRAAHRTAEVWERLDARRLDAVEVVVNRISKNTAVQPRLIGQTSAMPVCRTGIPASFGAMEPLANEGASGLRSQRPLARPLLSLALHFGILPPLKNRWLPLWRRQRPAPTAPAEPTAAATTDEAGPERGTPGATGDPVAAGSRADGGWIAADVAAIGLVATIGIVLALQLFLAAWSFALLGVTTPRAAQAIASGETAADVQKRLRESGGAVLGAVDVDLDGTTVRVTLPLPLVGADPGVGPRISSSAEVFDATAG